MTFQQLHGKISTIVYKNITHPSLLPVIIKVFLGDEEQIANFPSFIEYTHTFRKKASRKRSFFPFLHHTSNMNNSVADMLHHRYIMGYEQHGQVPFIVELFKQVYYL